MKPSLISIMLLFTGIVAPIASAQTTHERHHATGHSHNHPRVATPNAPEQELSALEIRADHSLHTMSAEWTDHNNRTLRLSDFAGDPLILVMFYGQCTGTCPMLMYQTWKLYRELSPQMQDRTRVLAVSFDHENDTPEMLRHYATPEQLALPNWHFVTSSPRSIRELATLTGVQYQKRSDGHYNHTNLITLLDAEGTIIARVDGITGDIAAAARKLDQIAGRQLP